MLFQLLARFGRAPVDKKVFFGESESFGVSFIFFFRFLVHIFYEPIRACVDEDGQ